MYENICNRLVLLNNINTTLVEAKQNILNYMLGYMIRGIPNSLDCNSCINCLFKKYLTTVIAIAYHHNLKNKGGLISGSVDAFKITIETEKSFLYYIDNLKKLNITILRKIINKIFLNQSIFQELDSENISILNIPHKLVIITLLTKKFLSISLKSFGKMFSSNILKSS